MKRKREVGVGEGGREGGERGREGGREGGKEGEREGGREGRNGREERGRRVGGGDRKSVV